jgi:hypothetical protein
VATRGKAGFLFGRQFDFACRFTSSAAKSKISIGSDQGDFSVIECCLRLMVFQHKRQVDFLNLKSPNVTARALRAGDAPLVGGWTGEIIGRIDGRTII